MKIKVKLFAGLQRYLPEGSAKNDCHLEISHGSTVGDVLDELNVPSKKHIGLMILVNGTHGNLDYVPNEGDTVSIFPIVAGG